MSIIYKSNDFESADEQYIVIIASCVGNKLKPRLEPYLTNFMKIYPHINYFSKRSDGSKDKPGTIKTFGGESDRLIIVCFSQYYPGKNNLPNDSRKRRMEWFKSCLEKIGNIPNLRTVAFSCETFVDSGIPISEYCQAIDDFAKFISLEKPDIKISIYNAPDLPNGSNGSNGVTERNWDTISENSDSAETDKVQAVKTFNEHEREREREHECEREPERESEHCNHDKKKKQKIPPPMAVMAPSMIGLRNVQTSIHRLDNLFIMDILKDPKIPVELPKPVRPLKQLTHKNSAATELVTPIGITEGVPKYVQELISINPSKPDLTVVYDANQDWTKPISKLSIDKTWQPIFQDQIIRDELEKLDQFFETEMENYGDFLQIYPTPQSNIFKTFQTNMASIRVVILGQDPYHANPEEAMGLAFSVPDGVKLPPSLKNIFKELADDISVSVPESGDLSMWVNEGVLLLNTSLTVRQKKPGSHLQHWEIFTNRVIELLSSDVQRPKVFLLWGSHAQKRSGLIGKHNKIIKTVHPSPLSAHKGWFGSKSFSKTNEMLTSLGLPTIDWRLT